MIRCESLIACYDMPLRIFISSVYRELQPERRALQEEIHKLQDLFIGMEFFGSDPGKPADYSVRRVQESDLYIGLFGNDYGSVEPTSGLSFTQLEYEAAIDRVPCLIYFKESNPDGAGTDARLTVLKDQLRTRHIVYTFKNTSDLKLQFLVDFIKLLRSDLFDKTVPMRRGAIPARALLSLSQGFIGEQIKSVGQDKYISEVYVTREAETEIAGFTGFEDTFRLRAAANLARLDSIRLAYGLGPEAERAVARARVALVEHARSENAQPELDELKRAFYFNEVENAIEEVNSLITEDSPDRFNLGVRALQSRLSGKAFVNRLLLAEVYDAMSPERFRSSRTKGLQTDGTYRKLMRLFPAHEEDKDIYLANEILKEITREIVRGQKRSLMLVDKAGTGKTNVACRIAERLVGEHPVVLLSGQMELSSEYDIESHIQQRLESAFSGIFTDWMNRVSSSLQESGKWLFIIIDGINENNRRPLLIQLLKGFLPRLEAKRIKVILTCRDLFWDIFRDTLAPYLFENPVPLHEFSEAEWERAVAAYFRKFEVECTLDKEARQALRNPLLLRFFCEAHRGQRLGRVSNLRLLSVFDLYIKRTGQSISERHEFLKPESVLNLLIAVAYNMWKRRSNNVSQVDVGVGPEASSDATSVYNLVVSENIILEEASHSYSIRKSVRFLYDEFMEYMIARSWVDEISASPDERVATSNLLQEAVESLGTFPPALGAVLFLDNMLERDGSVVNEFIKRSSNSGAFLLDSQQTSLVYAFERIDFANADDELIAAIQKFEPNVREDLRERLARVILKILEARPDHPYARTYVHQMLEVGPSNAGVEEVTRPAPPRQKSAVGSASSKKGERVPADAPRLPPARYHYTEETKISAIGVLVRMKDRGHDYEVIDQGIRKLGQTELHSALQALESLDLAPDQLVYKGVASYLKVRTPEYRIYCAWLLRVRYGRQAAEYLAELLTDTETRVHLYTAGLFEQRLIEQELLDEIRRRLSKDKDMKRWHLIHFIKLLRMRASFNPKELGDRYGSSIVESLEAFLSHEHASIRLEAYRAIAEYPTAFNADDLNNRIQQDSDPYIRSLADKLTSPRQ